MARVPSKHGRDQPLDFQGFLNDLQDWELSLKDKDKKMKSEAFDKQKLRSGKLGEERRPVANGPSENSKIFDSLTSLSSGFMNEENSPDATSEKELGNEYFKQKKFKEAIDCYSRSIAFSPTAVAHANRAMAYLKIKRFQEAEDDCTEALNLDDRYIKAYSRRATARKELGKLKGSIEDAEFALRLEPSNQEIKKQYAEAKSLYEKEIFRKASGELKNKGKGVSDAGKSKVEVNSHVQHAQPVSVDSQRNGGTSIQVGSTKDNDGRASMDTSMSIEDVDLSNGSTRSREEDVPCKAAVQSSGLESVKSNHRTTKQEKMASIQDLASRAASRAKDEAAKNITPPNSAYQFEASWRGFAGDCVLQARLLKAISPATLPQIFRNSLSAPILIDIIKCIATFFVEEMDLAIRYLENLTKVSRFDMIIMCLSSTDKADLLKIWENVFCGQSTPTEFVNLLVQLQSRYRLKN